MKLQDLRLLLSLGSSRKLFFGAILGALVSTAIVLANAFLIASIIVGIIYNHPSVIEHIIVLAILWAFRGAWTSLFDRWASGKASELKSALRSKVLTSPSIVISHSSSEITTLLIKGGNSLDIYLARFLPQVFSASITPFAVIVAIAVQDWLSALIAIITLPLIPFFGALIGRYTSEAVSAKWQSLGTLAKYFEDSLRGIHTLSIFGRLKSQGERIEEMGDRYTQETMKVLRISFLSALVLELAATISVAVIAVSVGLRLVNDSMQFFPALVILILAPEIYFPLRNAASLFHASADGGAALSELTAIIQNDQPLNSGGVRPVQRIESIQWSQWSPPFEGVNSTLPALSVRAGNAVVIRGGSGLGKTTFLSQLLGITRANGISINGVDLCEYETSQLHRLIGWIPQLPSLTSGTLRELFHLVDGVLTDADITQALIDAGLELSSLGSGLDTRIGGLGEKSAELSGGQIRKIAIARALIRRPALIIADEPTADLDPESAEHILNLLSKKAKEGCIVIAVLHAPDHRIEGAEEIEMVQR